MANSSVGPLHAALFLEALADALAQLEQVGHITGGIGELTGGQGPARPIRQLIALQQPHPENPLDEVDQGGGHLAQEPGRHLCVEQPVRHGPAGVLEDLEVLLRGMHHREARALQHPCQW